MGTPAKLSAPRLFDTAPRERLFGLLDGARAHPVIWVESPPGAGKTSLVASYLEARQVLASWYQVDAGDGDVATFFYYLRQLAGAGGGELPLFAPEYRDDVPGFARRFFRAFFARLPAPAVLVLDNLHEAAANPAFLAVLGEAIREIPAGVNLVLISRWEPPPVFARFLALGAIRKLGWAELRLTAAEAAAIAGLDPGADDGAIARVLAACDGWAAGLTLMLARQGGEAGGSEAREATFDFLAAEILDGADAATRDFLLRTWMLPWLTPAWAGELSGQGAAERILAALFRRNYFIERRQGAEASYQYHGLFRDFLAARARALLPPAAIAGLERRAAQLLEGAGEFEAAIALLQAAGEMAACRPLVIAAGKRLAGQGRLQTLAGWIDALPVDLADSSPWICYWRGVCDLGGEPERARQAFARAEAGFAAAGDNCGCIKAITGVIDTYYAEWSDFSALDPCIARLVALLDASPAFPGPADELQAVASALVAMLYRQPRHPRLPELAARAHVLLGGAIAADERVAAGTYLLNCDNWMGDTGAARAVIARVTPHLDAPGVTPLRRAWWLARLAYHHYISGDAAATREALAAAERIAREHGLAVVHNIVLLYQTFHHLSQGDVAGARAVLAEVEPRLAPGRRLDLAIARYQRAWIALLEGQVDLARQWASQAAALAEAAGVPNVQGYFLLLVAYAAGAGGDPEGARQAWAAGHGCSEPQRFPLFEFTAQLVGAHLQWQAGDPVGSRQALAAALAVGACHDYANNLFWLPAMLSPLAVRALAWDLEADYVGRLIRRRQLPPPGPEASHWPWPLKVHTLGAFRVDRAGETLAFSRKAQKRPLALLMALVALGGQDINAGTLAEQLWPDADGDAARAALGTALYRLRHLLDTDDAILLAEGKLALNRERVWVDAWAFASLAGTIAAGRADGLEETADRLFALYPGHFLDREDEAPWMLAPRERLKATFLRAVETLGRAFETAGQWELAARIYERGIDLDPLAETLYRQLMHCQQRLGRRAQAIETYRRCRQALSVVLGIPPGAETEALRRRLDEP